MQTRARNVLRSDLLGSHSPTGIRNACLCVATAACAFIAAPTFATPSASSATVPPAAVPPGKATPDQKPGAEKPKSLDELLGLPGARPAVPDAAPVDDPTLRQAEERLERRLDGAALETLLQQALAGMQTSADQLRERTDTGLLTQRVQADVVAKLDLLIEEAKKQCKGGSCKGGGKGSGQANAQPKPGSGQKPGDKDAPNGQPGESKSKGDGMQTKAGNEPGVGDGPSPVDPDDEQTLLDESQSEWGMLPARVRDVIRQGSRERIAAMYQRLTEEYYRRMAEDASR
ncbi:MAG: hypothetical protein SGJ11_13790 [Phycisphaerae bacterium]|nr:hypothetical protein [Phycisphaerae bacterium]